MEGLQKITKTRGADKYKQISKKNYALSKSVSIWPFAGYGRSKNRNPSVGWWEKLISNFTKQSINVYHFGYINEPILSNNDKFYHNLTNLDFFYFSDTFKK